MTSGCLECLRFAVALATEGVAKSLIEELELCKHENVETKILGKKKQFVATVCKDCGLLLEFEDKRRVDA